MYKKIGLFLVGVLIGSGIGLSWNTLNKPEPLQHHPSKVKAQSVPQGIPMPPPLAGGPESRGRKGTAVNKNIDLSRFFPGLVFLRGNTHSNEVALTFDDGPDDRFTPQILDVLKANKVKATFFLIGNRIKKFPDVVKRMVNEGHAIGNHTWDHHSVEKLTLAQLQNEVSLTDRQIMDTAGVHSDLFRPPYGAIRQEAIPWVGELGYRIFLWNVDSLDWLGLKQDQVTQNILGHVQNGSIVLQHSSGGPKEDLTGTVQALGGIIQQLKAEGYHFVTGDEIVKRQPIGQMAK